MTIGILLLPSPDGDVPCPTLADVALIDAVVAALARGDLHAVADLVGSVGDDATFLYGEVGPLPVGGPCPEEGSPEHTAILLEAAIDASWAAADELVNTLGEAGLAALYLDGLVQVDGGFDMRTIRVRPGEEVAVLDRLQRATLAVDRGPRSAPWRASERLETLR